MTFEASWFEPWILWIANALYAFVAVMMARCARKTTHTPMATFIAAMLVMMLWSMNISFTGESSASLNYHFLALNLASLLLGAPMAWWLGNIALLILGWQQQGVDFLDVFTLNTLCVVLPACALNAALRRLTLRYFPPHIFIYIFINAFLSGALGMLLTGIFVLIALPSTPHFAELSPFFVFILLSWGEAFLSGIGAATCVAFKPEWLRTFDDSVYLRPKKRIWK